MKRLLISAAVLSVCLLGATPYGRALNRARNIAGHGSGNVDFRQVWIQLEDILTQHKGKLPGPSGFQGVKKICVPGAVSPSLLKIKDVSSLNEKNCPAAYFGGELGSLRALPPQGNFPVMFLKPVPGIRNIQVLTADGSVKVIAAGNIRSCKEVIRNLRNSSSAPKSPIWKNLTKAAEKIDKAK